MTTPNTPIVNAGLLYVNGLVLSSDATTPDEVVNCTIGECRDSTNTNDISVTSVLSASNIVSGAGGLDTGAVAADTFYAVHVVADSTGYESPALMFSLSATAPVIPGGYDMFRRVGYALTDGTSDFIAFDQRGKGQEKTMWYRDAVATDITNGGAAAWAAVDVSDSIPVASCTGLFEVAFTPTADNDHLLLRSGDSATDAAQATLSGSAAAVLKSGNLVCPVGATLASGIDYEVIGTTTAINVQGYVDSL